MSIALLSQQEIEIPENSTELFKFIINPFADTTKQLKVGVTHEEKDSDLFAYLANETKWFTLFLLSIIVNVGTLGYLLYLNCTTDIRALTKARKLVDEEIKNKEIVNSKLVKEIELRQTELINYTLNVIQRNTLLESVSKSLMSFKQTLPQEYSKKLESIIIYLNSFITGEKNWMYFKNYFENVNTSFFDNLKKAFPEITHQELKICALSKLNLSLKEIASILGISPESVKVTRSRIKKKLNLKQDEDFIKFLNSQLEETGISNF